MIGFSILNQIFQNLFETGLVEKIYHDVSIIIQSNGVKVPAYRQGADFVPIGLDDRKSLYCYVRQLSDAVNIKTEFIGSPEKKFNVKIPYRFVFFNANEERSFDNLTAKILNISFGQYVEFVKLTTDFQQLQSIEGNINDFTLTGKAFYIGLDLNVLLKLTKVNCEIEIQCDKLPNPICKE